MTDSSTDEQFFRERGFGQRLGFGARPALIVIDLINAFTDPELPLGAPLDKVVDSTRRLLASARRAAIPVVFTTIAYEEEDLGGASVWLRKARGSETLRAGTRAVEIDTRLERLPDEPVLVKRYASAFFGTDLVTRLNARQVDTLIVTGCTTSGCVRASAVDAVQYGFVPAVVRDAVGDRSEAAHRQSLFDLEQKYADVVTSAETVAYLAELAETAHGEAP
jgi:nicotinamidase-related amidase